MAAATNLISRESAIFIQRLCSMSDFLTPSSSLVTIGTMVMKWQPIFEVQDGGRRHLELS
jgi:hypothetical protein